MNEDEARRLVDGLDWLSVWSRLEHAETVARGILDAPDDPRRDEAAQIIGVIARVWRAYERGWNVPAGEMESLRRLSDAANAKITGPLIDESLKRRDRFVDAVRPHNERTRQAAEAQRAEWQSAADEIWTRHPDWTATAVAKQIAKRHGGKADTIRRRIQSTRRTQRT